MIETTEGLAQVYAEALAAFEQAGWGSPGRRSRDGVALCHGANEPAYRHSGQKASKSGGRSGHVPGPAHHEQKEEQWQN
jgi:hypothetical protein